MSIPKTLTDLNRWVCFGADKQPIDPVHGSLAKSTDSNTWASYATATEAVGRFGCRGVGFVLGDGISGIDIDHCIDPETGAISDIAAEIVETMRSYTEYSPSGTGLHILWRGQKPPGACRNNKRGLEMYSTGRYFTVTGRAFADYPLRDGTEAAAALHAKYWTTAPKCAAAPPLPAASQGDDQDILQKARAARSGDKLAALLAGAWQGYATSQSEADLALCNLLAFWFGCDKARMDGVFRRSGLYRKKWDERHGAATYGSQTLDKAIADCQEVYDPARAVPQESFADAGEFLRSMGVTKPPCTPTSAAPGKKETQYSMDDTGNARRFRDLFGERVRYNYTQKCWMVWNGAVWHRDETATVKQMCDEMLDGMEKNLFGLHDPERTAALRRFIGKSRGSHAKDNLLTEAQHLAGIPATDADFDRHRGVFNLKNGTLKLRSGTLSPHSRAMLLTRLSTTIYDPDAGAPTWQAFLHSVTGGDTELQIYLQCMVGYMLSGSTREQCLFFLYGEGSNGKSTFLDVLAELMGNYAMNTQSETITQRRQSDGPRTDIARLKGARLVTISECPADVWLDEAMVKQLTGGDTVTARYLYGREFEFKPEFKLIMATNHKPRIRGTDTGIWRRIRLVPFTQCIPPEKQDLQLPDKLHAEMPGILNWAVAGVQMWLKASNGGKRRGLPPCAAVDSATKEYRGEQDRLKSFVEDCTACAPGYTIQASVLYQVYRKWCEENGERFPLTGNKFGREMGKLFEKEIGRSFSQYKAVRLSDEGNRLMVWALSGSAKKQESSTSPTEQLKMQLPKS